MVDVERVDVSEHKDVLPEELSGFDALVRTESPKYLYGEDAEGKRTRITDMGGVILHFAAKATGEDVKRVSGAAETGSKKEKSTPAGIDIDVLVNRMVEERVRQALTERDDREKGMQEEIDKLRKEIERLQKPLNQRLDEDFGDNWVPRNEGIVVSRRGNDGYMDEGWATVGQPYEKDGKWYIRIKKEANEEEAELTSLSRIQETPPAEDTEETNALPANVPEGSRQVMRPRSRWAMWGDRIRRRPVQEYEATGVYAPPEGGYVREVNGEVVEVTESDVERRAGIGFLGGAALVGAGMVIGATVYELLEHKYMGHSPSRELRNNGVWPWGHLKGGGSHHEVLGGHGPGNGNHTDFYNPAPGHRRTAVEASSTIRLVGQPGNEHLVDGHKVLLGGHKVEFDSQGKLSWWDRVKLRKEGYDIGWGRIQDKLRHGYRMKTIVTKP
jgi:hypothetical protein